MTTAPAVRDDPARSRFVLEQDGVTAQLLYEKRPGRLVLVHTEVPEALGGRGVGGQLVRAAVASAVADGLTVVAWCEFARGWLEGHADVANGVDIDWSEPLPQE